MIVTKDLSRVHDKKAAIYVKRGQICLWIAIISGIVLIVALIAPRVVFGHDSGQWEGSDPTIRQWYRGLMQPDNPSTSCCGTADAYWCDDIHVRSGKTFCQITDDRPDGPLMRPHRDSGTEIEIPDRKLKWDRGNPTGHSIVFLSASGYVFCFVQGMGI